MFSLINFPNQQPGEKIVVFLRRHIFVFFCSFLFYVLLIILPIIIYVLFKMYVPEILDAIRARPILYPFSVMVISIYFLSTWLFLFYSFLDYYLDVWIVTNKRIINIEQKGLFSRTIAEQRLFRVQDVTSEVKGIIPTILNYGNVFIQTAGSKERFVFKQVPFP